MEEDTAGEVVSAVGLSEALEGGRVGEGDGCFQIFHLVASIRIERLHVLLSRYFQDLLLVCR